MNILNVNSSLDLRVGAGTAERTIQMSRFLSQIPGVNVDVLSTRLGLDSQGKVSIGLASVFFISLIFSRFIVPFPNFFLISRLVRKADVIHLMGYWDPINIYVWFFAKLYKKSYVLCPAGALRIYGRSLVIKKVFNFLVGRRMVFGASALIAVTEMEAEEFIAYGVSREKVVVIPNGILCADYAVSNKVKKYSEERDYGNYVLYMGRLNEIKGVDILIDSFRIVAQSMPNLSLVLAGPDGGMENDLRARVAEYQLCDRVYFTGYLEGGAKIAAYSKAEILVVPSRFEAMSIVALEAGACLTPALVTSRCGLPEVTLIDERLEVEPTVQDISSRLIDLLSDSGKLYDLGSEWNEYVTKNYDWPLLSYRYLELYKAM